MKKIIVCLFFFLVVCRITYLYKDRNVYNQLYLKKTNVYVYGPSAPRGKILDINGNV